MSNQEASVSKSWVDCWVNIDMEHLINVHIIANFVHLLPFNCLELSQFIQFIVIFV